MARTRFPSCNLQIRLEHSAPFFVSGRELEFPCAGQSSNVQVKDPHSPFLHYPLVPSFKKINIGNTGNQNPPEGGYWLPVFPILIFVSRKPADNAKIVISGSNPGRFAPKPFRPLVVSPPRRFPPSRFPPSRFAPTSRFVPLVVSSP